MDLSARMKEYESVTKNRLMINSPAIIRVDGKAFHTWTRGLERPFDYNFYACMAQTAKELVENIQGAIFAYGQSDEISIFLKDYDTINTQQWFNGSVQKIVSVSASLATGYFNKYANSLEINQNGLAFFDSRVFNLPAYEVVNYFIWRQQDFLRNSVHSVARHYLGHKKCHGLSRNEMIDALANLEEPIIWGDFDAVFRHGYFYQKGTKTVNLNIPDFVSMRDFIEVHVLKTTQE
jgi:tRNA(His) 5'-end guanylyltransferase